MSDKTQKDFIMYLKKISDSFRRRNLIKILELKKELEIYPDYYFDILNNLYKLEGGNIDIMKGDSDDKNKI